MRASRRSGESGGHWFSGAQFASKTQQQLKTGTYFNGADLPHFAYNKGCFEAPAD